MAHLKLTLQLHVLTAEDGKVFLTDTVHWIVDTINLYSSLYRQMCMLGCVHITLLSFPERIHLSSKKNHSNGYVVICIELYGSNFVK